VKAAIVVGARPNFMKAAPLIREFRRRGTVTPLLVHTGQHYDRNMSKAFFEDLELPEPDIYLGVGSGTHAEQTGKIMIAFEEVLDSEKPDLIIVVGDVNSTLACSLDGAKMSIPVAHVEAGLRSFDLEMPEEINRMVTDILSKFCFTTSPEAETNLKREGVSADRIYYVGNIMIDSLLHYLEKADSSTIMEDLNIEEGNFALTTLHRPSNVDVEGVFRGIWSALSELSGLVPVVFPMHPRTRKMIDCTETPFDHPPNLHIVEPVGYLDFLKAMKSARLVITDSGGIQEETTVLGVPCLTVRNNTERPITIEMGTNVLVGTGRDKIISEAVKVLEADDVGGETPPLWDGKTAPRIADVLEKHFP